MPAVVARQLEDNTQILLDDPMTFPIALGSGVALAVIALFVYMSSPFEYRQELSLPFGILFFTGDLFFVLSTRNVRILLDKKQKTMMVEKFSLVGKKRFLVDASTIKKVTYRREGQFYLLNIPIITFFFNDGRSLSYDYLVDEPYDASVVASFLDVPLDVSDEDEDRAKGARISRR